MTMRWTQYFIILFFILFPSCNSPKVAFGGPSNATGEASWYSYESCIKEGTSGRKTASGQNFNENALTCASWDHSFGTRLKVTNINNGKSVIVTVTDRGPNKKLYRRGRIIDLSRASFAKIAKLSSGIIKVRIEVING